jgi:hypothetical protein
LPILDTSPKVALFIDAANLIFPLEQEFAPFRLARIVSRVREEGVILSARSYADWSREPCNAYVAQFHALGIEMIEAYADEKRKNTADMLITTDALEHSYSEHSADIYALISGDRDFVPLVQALHRRGKTVLCIGITSRTSPSLRRISDIYIDYYSLIPRGKSFVSPREVQPIQEPAAVVIDEDEGVEVSGDPKLQAFHLLRRSVAALLRRGEETKGTRVYGMIRQLKPDFDFQALGFETFKDFVEEAVTSGQVQFSEGKPKPGAEFSLNAAGESSEEAVIPSPHFESSSVTPELVLSKYRDILNFKRIPWVDWDKRLQLVGQLWKKLSTTPMTISQMSELMEDIASEKQWEISSQAIYKLTYTLNIGLCFVSETRPIFIRDIFNTQLKTAVDLTEALERMHVTYIKGIRMEAPNIPLLPEAVCDLLFEQRSTTFMKQSQAIIAKVESGREYN